MPKGRGPNSNFFRAMSSNEDNFKRLQTAEWESLSKAEQKLIGTFLSVHLKSWLPNKKNLQV